MNKNDVEKALMQVVAHVKETTSRNIMNAAGGGRIKVDRGELPGLFNLINQSIDQAINETTKSFLKAIDAAEQREVVKTKKK